MLGCALLTGLQKNLFRDMLVGWTCIRECTQLQSAPSKIMLTSYQEQISLSNKIEVNEGKLNLQALEEGLDYHGAVCISSHGEEMQTQLQCELNSVLVWMKEHPFLLNAFGIKNLSQSQRSIETLLFTVFASRSSNLFNWLPAEIKDTHPGI